MQLGISLQLPRAAAGEMVTAVLPEIQDAMRQTLLGFKSEDLQTPTGVNKVRKAMTDHLNEVMARVLGAERVAKMTDGTAKRRLCAEHPVHDADRRMSERDARRRERPVPYDADGLGSLSLTLGIIVLLLWGGIWAMRRMRPGVGLGNARDCTILRSLALGPRERLVVVRGRRAGSW